MHSNTVQTMVESAAMVEELRQLEIQWLAKNWYLPLSPTVSTPHDARGTKGYVY